MYQRDIYLQLHVRVQARSAIEVDKFHSELRRELIKIGNQQARQKRFKVNVVLPATVE